MKYQEYLNRFGEVNVLVIGDIILDEYIFTDVSRISPEAPVQVCLIKDKKLLLGGAANVAHNITALGGNCIAIGVTGTDAMGKKVHSLFEERNISTLGLIQDGQRPTTTKSRILAHNQQLLRMDDESSEHLSEDLHARILQAIEVLAEKVDAIILEDYGKGVIDEEVICKSIEVSKKYDLPILVDPKVENFKLYKDITIMTPNHFEASKGAGIEIRDKESLLKAGDQLIRQLNMKGLLITQGGEGMTLFKGGQDALHIPTIAKEVYDVTGAGDTVIALLGMCLGLDSDDFYHASMIANAAAGLVVGKVGTATVVVPELQATLLKQKIMEPEL